MKAYLLHLPLVVAAYFISNNATAQTALAPDQNPDFAVSRDKYLKMADSVNAWHSTTIQDTYKAIDWLVDRQEAREQRRESRRQLRYYRAGWYDNNYYDNGYYSPYNNHRFRYYNNRSRYYSPNYYRRHRSSGFWWNPWCF